MPGYRILHVYCSDVREGSRATIAELEQLVSEAVQDGWVPLGGVVVGQDGNCFDGLLQTMWHP